MPTAPVPRRSASDTSSAVFTPTPTVPATPAPAPAPAAAAPAARTNVEAIAQSIREYGDTSRIHSLTAEIMAALAAKRPRDPWGFMSRCFRDGKVLDEEASESDFAQPFTVYFEPKLAEALRDVVARCLRLRPESPLGWIGRELGQGRAA